MKVSIFLKGALILFIIGVLIFILGLFSISQETQEKQSNWILMGLFIILMTIGIVIVSPLLFAFKRHLIPSLVTFFFGILVYFDNDFGIFTGSPNDYYGLGSLLGICLLIFGYYLLFSINLILYKAFFYFKLKKQLVLFFTIVLIVEYFIVSVTNLFNNLQYQSQLSDYISMKIHCKELSKEFENYKDISNTSFQANSLEMKLAFKSLENISHYLTYKNDLIVETVEFDSKKKDTVKIFYKLNNLGNVIDEIHLKNDKEELYFKGYFINIKKEYYRTWSLDGDTIKKKFGRQNEKFKWSNEEQKKLYTEIKNSKKLYFTEELERDEKINEKEGYKIYYLQDGKWKIFYENIDRNSFKDLEEEYQKTLIEINFLDKYSYILSDLIEKESSDIFASYHKIKEGENSYDEPEWKLLPNKCKNVKLVYFHKLKRENANWSGTLYSNIIFKKDTIKIKEFLNLDSSKTDYPVIVGKDIIGFFYNQLYYDYSNKYLKYHLFTNDYKKLYIIKHTQ
jgi:hypothetical protein